MKGIFFNTGSIIGAAIAGVISLVLIILLVLYFSRRYEKQKNCIVLLNDVSIMMLKGSQLVPFPTVYSALLP